MLYIGLGIFVTNSYPIQPPIVLWINFVMDTFAASILAAELPRDNYEIL